MCLIIRIKIRIIMIITEKKHYKNKWVFRACGRKVNLRCAQSQNKVRALAGLWPECWMNSTWLTVTFSLCSADFPPCFQECVNPCCNASTCTLKGDAACAHGQCCQDCQVSNQEAGQLIACMSSGFKISKVWGLKGFCRFPPHLWMRI